MALLQQHAEATWQGEENSPYAFLYPPPAQDAHSHSDLYEVGEFSSRGFVLSLLVRELSRVWAWWR